MKQAEAIRKLNARELELGIAGTSASWHADYATSPVVRVAGVPKDISDQVLLAVFEQYGAVDHLNVPRDAEGNAFVAFLGYADPLSAILAVDNLNGITIRQRTISVDHVHVNNYSYPPNSEYNVRIEKPKVKREENTAAAGSTNNAAPSGVGEDEVMARLRAMKKRLAAEEREARAAEDDNDDGVSGYKVGRKRSRSKAEVEGARVQPQRRDTDAHGNASEKAGGRKQEHGSKEARRLERAAIREERRRRRARRVARGGDIQSVGGGGGGGGID